MKKAKSLKPPKKAKKATKRAGSSVQAARIQVAALPWRTTEDALEIMLISSRGTGRWIVPKGWPMAGRRNSAAAAIEALEEAGLLGVISDNPIGSYSYLKRFAHHDESVHVEVFSLRVTRQRETWREKEQRVTQWFAADEAAKLVSDPELVDVIAKLAGDLLPETRTATQPPALGGTKARIGNFDSLRVIGLDTKISEK